MEERLLNALMAVATIQASQSRVEETVKEIRAHLREVTDDIRIEVSTLDRRVDEIERARLVERAHMRTFITLASIASGVLTVAGQRIVAYWLTGGAVH